MPKSKKNTSENENKSNQGTNEDEIETIDMDFFELFEVLNEKEIVKLLNAVGGKFSTTEGNTIKKLVNFLNSLDDDKIDDLIDAFDDIMRKG
jgi:hypothetical protein